MAKIEDKFNIIPDIIGESQRIDGTTITAGVHSDEGSTDSGFRLSDLAFVHEFGTKISVTPAMRRWFAAIGFPLNPDTDVIVIPARPFLRPGFKRYEKDVDKIFDNLLGGLLDNKMSKKDFVNRIGLSMQQAILDNFGEHGPALSGMTIERKGSSRKLVDTGRLRQSITFQESSD